MTITIFFISGNGGDSTLRHQSQQEDLPGLAVSTVIFALRSNFNDDEKQLWVPLVRRTREPFFDQWALPGGPLKHRDSLVSAAANNLRETTGLEPKYLEQLYAFGDPDRSMTERVVSIVYWALVRETEISHSDKAIEDPNVRWFRVTDQEILQRLAFDHQKIIEYALWRLRNKVEYGFIAHHLLGERFTLSQVQQVYETVLGKSLDPANFRRQLRTNPDLEETDEYLTGVSYRPPKLYRYTGPQIHSPENESVKS